MAYCASRFQTVRRQTREVTVGSVGVGGTNPVRIQSMTTSDTQDITATVRQSIALAEVGCEIVRITAPNVQAAKCLQQIRGQFSAAGFSHVPLVADIHFLPQAAMEAVEHVEKVRINPGNYADKKKFAVREYSDTDYNRELQRLHDAFTPLVKRSLQLGRSLRIGTNHGSLSDRIMNRYGDTPLGMVESALEFLRIAESHSFRQIILSMKASNPKVMIEAYRLLVERMQQEDMHYPLHLGVTEAGDGEDGRIKSAIGIGSLLFDGLGDTIRVSLTEDSVYEIPVARALVDKAMSLWSEPVTPGLPDSIDPFHFTRRETTTLAFDERCVVGPEQPPRVIVRAPSVGELPGVLIEIAKPTLEDTPAEGVLVSVRATDELTLLANTLHAAPKLPAFVVIEIPASLALSDLQGKFSALETSLVFLRAVAPGGEAELNDWAQWVRRENHFLSLELSPAHFAALAPALRTIGDERLVFTVNPKDFFSVDRSPHPTGAYRQLAELLHTLESKAPIWMRNTVESAVRGDRSFLSKLLDASILTGTLLCDGLGDLISIETEADAIRATRLSYNVLQGAGARISKTEFVACPSCGRTLFDLQATTQRIREKTGHLKGVKLAIMGCIVNGPGEMADADFGYVGGAPGKINLYAGKNCVQYNIPQVEADDRLIALIKEHGKWSEPKAIANAIPRNN